MKWEIKNNVKIKTPEEIQSVLLEALLNNRGIKTKKDKETFLDPKKQAITVDSVGINKQSLTKALTRIRKAIEKKEQIIVYGDYDVDGICGSAILWETLHDLGANVLPYIPHRIEEGYGLSKTGILNLKSKTSNVKLIITVDNGIVANEAVEFAREQGIDVIITDHHLPHEDKKHVLPNAYAIVHTTKLCGAGVAWLLCQEIRNSTENDHLALAALATIADMVPLVEANRSIVVRGLLELQKTQRIGLLALFDEAGIDQKETGVYEVSHVIAPRLNATGRMASAMDSLRLLCTRDKGRAVQLAGRLGEINKERQLEMSASSQHAISQVEKGKLQMAKLLFVAHESYQQGVIGLVAGKLVERFYRPAIVVSLGEEQSKASVRSVRGFNIIEFLRQHTEYFVNVGGHPMAAGFTVETAKISLLQQTLEKAAEKVLLDEYLQKTLHIDCELQLEVVDQSLYSEIQKLSPFGIGNPEPLFVSRNVVIDEIRTIGKDSRHLKMRVRSQESDKKFEAIGFGMGDRSNALSTNDVIDIVYTLSENQWNGEKRLQLKLRDFNQGSN